MPECQLPAIVRFDIFEIDSQAGELRKDGRRVKLQEQPFRVLSLLLQRHGQVVTREELREQLWPADTFVDFDHGLNSAVARLREALRDSADKPRFIETIAKRGYRFIAPVRAGTLSEESSKVETHPRPQERKPEPIYYSHRKKLRIFATLGLTIVCVSVVPWFIPRPQLRRTKSKSFP